MRMKKNCYKIKLSPSENTRHEKITGVKKMLTRTTFKY